MAFKRELAQELCEKLEQGIDERIIADYHGLELSELYNLVDFQNSELARNCLRHFCSSYINYVCTSWPNCEEHLCSAYGYAVECPLKK